MAKKKTKKSKSNILLEKFNGEVSAVVCANGREVAEIKNELSKYGITFTEGDLPKMNGGKTVGYVKQLTVIDRAKLNEVLSDLKNGKQ